MPYFNVPNFSKVVLRVTHSTPTTVVLQAAPSPYHSHNRFPATSDVRSSVVYGPGQYEQQEYLTGSLVPSGGTSGVFIINE